jgi:hypothetical protein
MALSFAQNVLDSRRPVVLFHTWTVTSELLARAIREKRSMDLDVCVDDRGNPYLGHPREYHEKTHEPFFNSSRIVGSGLISVERTFSRRREDQTMSALRTEALYPRDVSVQLDLRHSRTERQDQP